MRSWLSVESIATSHINHAAISQPTIALSLAFLLVSWSLVIWPQNRYRSVLRFICQPLGREQTSPTRRLEPGGSRKHGQNSRRKYQVRQERRGENSTREPTHRSAQVGPREEQVRQEVKATGWRILGAACVRRLSPHRRATSFELTGQRGSGCWPSSQSPTYSQVLCSGAAAADLRSILLAPRKTLEFR